MWRRVGAATVGAMVLALTLTGCAGPRNSLNTSASVCFRTIPMATNAVGHRGRLIGVRRRSNGYVARRLPGPTTPPSAGPVCLVAFHGDYHAGEISGTHESGRYAIVAVAARSRHVLRVRVTNKLPLRFRHRV